MAKECLECGEKLFGRVDKKFCSDACRNAYNNKLNSDATKFVRNINNTLRKNRRILASLNPDGTAKVKRDDLLLEGFNFNYFTNIYRTKAGKVYYFCYDYGYLILEDDTIAIVERQEYVK